MAEIEFPKGIIVKAPHPKAPSFVKCAISIKRVELQAWLAGRSDEWINLDVKESRGGKWYCSVSTYKRNASEPVKDCPQPETPYKPPATGGGNLAQEETNGFEDGDIPFITNGGIW